SADRSAPRGGVGGTGLKAVAEPVKERSHPVASWVQPLVEIRLRVARRDFVELPRCGSGQGVGDVLEEPGLEKRAQRFGGHRTLKLQGVFLALIEDQKGVIRHEVPPLARNIECRPAPYRLEGQGRAGLLNAVVPRNPPQDGRAAGQLPDWRIEAELKVGHVAALVLPGELFLRRPVPTDPRDTAGTNSRCGRERPNDHALLPAHTGSVLP